MDAYCNAAGSSAMSTVEEKLNLIDTKIAELASALLCLKLERNEIPPISQLPPEILSRIFDFALSNTVNRCVSGRALDNPGQPSFNPKVSLSFTHVSHRWRSVALHNPYLWRKLPFAFRKWTNVMLERSGISDLVIELDFESYGGAVYQDKIMHQIEDVLVNHSNRIQDIDLPGIGPAGLKTLLSNLPKSSLRPTSLLLTMASAYGQSATDLNTNAVDFSNLRRLHLAGPFDFPQLYSRPPSKLTYLRVEKSSTICPTMFSFVAALWSMPALQVLHLEDSFPSSSDTPSDVVPVRLTNLQQLHLRSRTTLDNVSNVLSAIVVPVEAIISLAYTNSNVGEDEMAGFISSLSTFFSSMGFGQPKQPYQTLDVYSDDGSGALALSFFCGECVDTLNSTIDFKLNIPHQANSLLQKVMSSIPLHHHSLMSLSHPLKSNALIEAFGQLQQLWVINVYYDCVAEFITAMEKVDKTLGSEAETVAFPGLHTLVIVDGVFSSQKKFGIDPSQLESCLKIRNKHDGKLKRLGLGSCHYISNSDVQSLRQLVDDVEWDGCELGEEEMQEA